MIFEEITKIKKKPMSSFFVLLINLGFFFLLVDIGGYGNYQAKKDVLSIPHAK